MNHGIITACMMYILFVVLLVFILALHCGVKPVELYVNCKEKKYNERKTPLEEGIKSIETVVSSYCATQFVSAGQAH